MKKFLKIQVVGKDGSVLYSNDLATPQVLMAVFECFSAVGTVVTTEVCEFSMTSESESQK